MRNASPMQRLTLIFVRLMLATVISAAVWTQFGWLALGIGSPVGAIHSTVSEFGITLEYYDVKLNWQIRHDIRLTDTLAVEDIFLFHSRWDEIFFHTVATRVAKVSLPGIVVGYGTIVDYPKPMQGIFAAVRHVWIIVTTLLLNVVAHWRVRRRILRAKSPKPQGDS